MLLRMNAINCHGSSVAPSGPRCHPHCVESLNVPILALLLIAMANCRSFTPSYLRRAPPIHICGRSAEVSTDIDLRARCARAAPQVVQYFPENPRHCSHWFISIHLVSRTDWPFIAVMRHIIATAPNASQSRSTPQSPRRSAFESRDCQPAPYHLHGPAKLS
jgi:hypothetical protein